MPKKKAGPKQMTMNQILDGPGGFKLKKNGKVEGSLEVQHNGLAGALGIPFAGPGVGYPWNQGVPGTAPVENVGTIFRNLRYYFISNMRQVLNQAYVELGLVQTIIDVPVDDALRGGIIIKSKQLDEDQIDELEAYMDRQNDLQKVAQAAKWNRLFGGAGLVLNTEQDPKTPLDLNRINKDAKVDLLAADMWELFSDSPNIEVFSSETQEENDHFEFYNYYSERVHKSRVLIMKGLEAPSFVRPRLRGWGFSVVEMLVRSINQYLKATDLSFEVLDEFKLDIYHIKGLVNTLFSPQGEQQVRQRVQMANYGKNFQNAVVLDSEDKYDSKQLSFAGLAEAMAQIRMQVAADMRMPLTKLFGISAAGFNSGEDDIEVYNAMIESQVRNKMKYHLLKVVEIRSQQLFGLIPDDLSIGFEPLRVMSSEQEQNVKNAVFNRVLAARTAGELTRYEFRESMNRAELLPITVDNSTDSLNPDDPDVADLLSGEPQPGQPGGDDSEGDREGSNGSGGDFVSRGESKGVPKAAGKSKLDAKAAKNSSDYDRAAYEVDGGDAWIADGRKPFFEKCPLGGNEALWQKAKQESVAAFGGKENWKFTAWKYKQLGGRVE